MTTKDIIPLLMATKDSFTEDKAPRLAAYLSYSTLFSIAPLLLIAIGVAGQVFGPEAAQGEIKTQLERNLGSAPAAVVQELIQNAYKNDPSRPMTAVIIGVAVALFGASGLFGALQDSLNTIWGVEPRPDLGLMGTIRARFVSFAMVLVVGFALLVSLALTAILGVLTGFMNGMFVESAWIVEIVNFAVGFLVTTLLFASIYKVLPDVEIEWHDVWIGAIATSILFMIGRILLTWYLNRGTESAYGSAGALIVLLLWVNYASQILFFGAEFTKVYANRFGSKIVPSDHAIAVSEEARARQGIKPVQSNSPLTEKKALAKQQNDKSKAPARPKGVTQEEARKEFEWTLSVVGGAAIALIWFFRRNPRS